MPALSATIIDTNMGPRNITAETKFLKDGKEVERRAIAEGSLVLAAYGGVIQKAEPNVLLIMQATVDAKYYDSYGSGVFQRVPCRNNPSESCFSDIPGYPFYKAIPFDTGPTPPEYEDIVEKFANKTETQFGGVVTYIDGNAYTFRTSTGRSVTFYLPDDYTERYGSSYSNPLPEIGTEIIVTTVGSSRDVISSDDLLYGHMPILED